MPDQVDEFSTRGQALDQSIFALERTIRSIDRAQGRLRDKKLDPQLSDDERRTISAEIGDLETKKENISVDVGVLDRIKRDDAFLAISLDPPTDTSKIKIKGLVQRVDELIQTEMFSINLINAATSLVEAARELIG